MSAPISPVHVEQEIQRLSARLEAFTDEIAERAQAAAEADANYKRDHAKAFLAADGPVDARKATADVDCAELYKERRVSEALLLSAQEACRNIRAQLDALRSINANVRHQVAA